MTRATKVMLEQYEAQIASLKRSYKSFKADLEKLDDKSLFMRPTQSEYYSP